MNKTYLYIFNNILIYNNVHLFIYCKYIPSHMDPMVSSTFFKKEIHVFYDPDRSRLWHQMVQRFPEHLK